MRSIDQHSSQCQCRVKKETSDTKKLKKSGPIIDPCGTPKRISLQELYVLFILTFCLLLSKKNVDISKMACLIHMHGAEQEVSNEMNNQKLLSVQSTVLQNYHLS